MSVWKELDRKVTENLKTSFDFEYFDKYECFELSNNLNYFELFANLQY